MILDELDSGVGARLGVPIAKLLSSMASARHAGLTSQIICISHLPQAGPIFHGPLPSCEGASIRIMMVP